MNRKRLKMGLAVLTTTGLLFSSSLSADTFRKSCESFLRYLRPYLPWERMRIRYPQWPLFTSRDQDAWRKTLSSRREVSYLGAYTVTLRPVVLTAMRFGNDHSVPIHILKEGLDELIFGLNKLNRGTDHIALIQWGHSHPPFDVDDFSGASFSPADYRGAFYDRWWLDQAPSLRHVYLEHSLLHFRGHFWQREYLRKSRLVLLPRGHFRNHSFEKLLFQSRY